MPCYVTGSRIGDAELHADEARKVATRNTDMLCTVMKRIEGTREFTQLPVDIRAWWEEHKKLDQAR